MLPSNSKDVRGICGHGQLVPAPLLSTPVLFSLLSGCLETRCPREHRLCQHFAEPTGVCVVGGEGQRGTILAHTSEHGLGIFHSMIWPLRQCHSDMFPPITAVSRQVPDTLLCQPSSKHLCAVRKNTCWPQRAALLTAKWLSALTEGQKNWHWGVWTKTLPLDCRCCGGMVKYK